jgi:hypothetical protein
MVDTSWLITSSMNCAIVPAAASAPRLNVRAESSPVRAQRAAKLPPRAEKRDEVASCDALAHSITSSARASSNGGTVRPSALAVDRLIYEIELSRLLNRKVGRLRRILYRDLRRSGQDAGYKSFSDEGLSRVLRIPRRFRTPAAKSPCIAGAWEDRFEP